jgi:hypothetical protein
VSPDFQQDVLQALFDIPRPSCPIFSFDLWATEEELAPGSFD